MRNNGVPLVDHAPKAALTQSIMALAESLTGESKEEGAADALAKPEKSGLFGFLAKAKK